MSLSLRLLPLAAVVLIAGATHAQLRQPGRPATDTARLAAEVPLVVLPSPDVAALKAEDEARGHRPYRYGAVLPTELGPETVGRWDEVAGGGPLVWRLRIASPGAFSLGVLFEPFDLPPGGRVFLYDPERREVLGAYTEANESPSGALAIQPLRGDEVVIEYVQESWSTEPPRLRVREVIHDYRDVFAQVLGGAAPVPPSRDGDDLDALCYVDINCAAGAGYQDVKRSVVQLLNGGACSGAILNNTAEDGTPYLLTADHCGNMTNAVVVFGYELPGCGSGTAPTNQTLSGAMLLASSSRWDSQLYRLNQTPPASYEPFYAGWGRGNGPIGPGVGIHHPQALPKKISIDNQAPVKSGDYWAVDWETGMVHGGSSGSPLFNGWKRVIGNACCVSGFACASQLVYYNRLNGFWSQKNLATWLDPLGLGVVGIDGYDAVHPQVFAYNGSGANPSVLTSTSPPALGTTWSAEIDVSGHPGATSTVLEARGAATSGQFFKFGELLVDLGSLQHFRSVAAVTAGVSMHSGPVPNDPGLAGLLSYVQGVILGGGAQATNALKLRLNYP